MTPSSVRACIQAAAMQSRVVECFYSEPDPEIVDLVHAWRTGRLASWFAGGSNCGPGGWLRLHRRPRNAAGGHVRGHISLLALLSEVLDVVDIPVVAAGGIGSGRSMAAALAAGADAVRVGTRFVASEEAEAHPFYVGALIDARAHDTIYTEAYSVSWSDAPHRVLRSGVEAAMAFSDEVVGTGFNIYTGQTYQLRRFERARRIEG